MVILYLLSALTIYSIVRAKLDIERAIGEISGIISVDKNAKITISHHGLVSVRHDSGQCCYSIFGLRKEIQNKYEWWLHR